MTRTVTHLFDNYDKAVMAGRALLRHGLNSDQVGLLVRRDDQERRLGFRPMATEKGHGDTESMAAEIRQLGVGEAPAKKFAQALENGASLIVVRAPEGLESEVGRLIEAYDPVPMDLGHEHAYGEETADQIVERERVEAGHSDGAPLSHLLHMPVLTDDAAPLSSLLHMPVLAKD
jgi:hypothetical protein